MYTSSVSMKPVFASWRRWTLNAMYNGHPMTRMTMKTMNQLSGFLKCLSNQGALFGPGDVHLVGIHETGVCVMAAMDVECYVQRPPDDEDDNENNESAKRILEVPIEPRRSVWSWGCTPRRYP